MKTKRITLFWKLTQTEKVPPPAVEIARKENWLTELQGTVEADYKPLIVRVTYELFNPEIEDMTKFFNGVCVLYFAIQNMDMFEGVPSSDTLKQYREEILDEMLGYDFQTVNKTVHSRKSTTDFKTVQAYNTFLNELQEEMFDSHGYIFPDSKEFWELTKVHGYDQARSIAIKNLQSKMKRKV